MILKQIELNNFRLCENAVIDFCDGVNLIYGKNASGKTNVLEAIYFFARGKSFRGGKDADITRFFENKMFKTKFRCQRRAKILLVCLSIPVHQKYIAHPTKVTA